MREGEEELWTVRGKRGDLQEEAFSFQFLGSPFSNVTQLEL